ncbi:hypothetical protein LU699_05735 [Luteimonas fraxinea]|uniref:Uncharacterized protein n=1 Tax=Luteimonas fraxinea TaxID=2901869 RepID=A0ABS8U7D1_9GAMM|nr:hypothetical protein [Luteimonas fraxinea]MCD9095588.1 hypothetical protein [Luteimonas fraxinea]MCD9126171.1 hypothetical protein [Luteimonas fraxinea]UHH11216.1 hypothetical protein LU699_05735 [Luteimonas fraxinea]
MLGSLYGSIDVEGERQQQQPKPEPTPEPTPEPEQDPERREKSKWMTGHASVESPAFAGMTGVRLNAQLATGNK